jgi:hypothetical protein
MAGSQYSPTDICPRCGYARMSSVYCSVSATHHGNDKPLSTPRREKRGLLQRIQELIGTDAGQRSPSDDSGDDGAGAAETAGQPLAEEQGGSAHSTPRQAGPAAAASSSWSLFKTKDEKQVDDLRLEEERCRQRIVETCMVDLRITEVNIKDYSKRVRGDQKVFKQERRDLEMACKTGFDGIYKERKEQLEVIQRIFTVELKKVRSEEKAAKKSKDAQHLPEPEPAAPEDK